MPPPEQLKLPQLMLGAAQSFSIIDVSFMTPDTGLILLSIRTHEYRKTVYNRKVLYLTSNGGESWHALSDSVRMDNQPEGAVYFSRTLILVADSNGVWRSTDCGKSWRFVDLHQHRMVSRIQRFDKYVYLEGSISLLRSSDEGLTWESLNVSGTRPDLNGPVVSVHKMCFGDSVNGFMLAQTDSEAFMTYFYSTRDGGRSWTLSQSGEYRDGETWFAGTERCTEFRHSPDGRVWFNYKYPSPERNQDHFIVEGVIGANTRGTLYSQSDTEIYRSTDFGNSWQYLTALPLHMTGSRLYPIDSNVSLVVTFDNAYKLRDSD